MRISDWSSDVCSSDLESGDHGECTDQIDLNHLAVDIHRMRRIVPPDRLDCRSQSRAVDQYAGHAMRRFGGGQSGLYAGLVGYIHPDEKTANRLCMGSEEHTSELQSLMRISYAVFCLKKKQN